MQTSKTDRKHPIRQLPLRHPGQSLQEQITDRMLSGGVAWALAAIFAMLMAVWEWVRYFYPVAQMPMVTTVLALALVLFARWKWQRTKRELESWKLGLKGERFVGQFLDSQLLPRKYYVLHDICGDGFNVDHVAIGPGGIFAIEVKTRSKPTKGDAQVVYDGEQVVIDGMVPDRNPVVQARAEAKWIKELLASYGGLEKPVRPVVLYPGWYVQRKAHRPDVWVLNEKAFIKFVDNEEPALSERECRVLAEGLARYVRERLELASH